jgi:hypothetical protein
VQLEFLEFLVVELGVLLDERLISGNQRVLDGALPFLIDGVQPLHGSP